MTYRVNQSWHGRMLLDVLHKELGLSRATVKHLKFKDNGITVNGAHVTVRYVLKENDLLSLAIEDTSTPEKLTPCKLPLGIAYEDGELVVPDKPSDMPTHQSFGHYGDTVANALTYRYTSQGLPFVFRPVNRLDRNTSGLLLIARNRMSAAYLSDAMKQGRIKKKYVAILKGVLTPDSGTIDTYMRRTAESIIVRENCGEGEGGDRAITEFQVLLRSDTHTLVCASPITGRTHQLRVHFAGLGCPIEGDDLYGESGELISRHALHSFMLSFPHPTDGKQVTVTAPLHEDMLSLYRKVFGEETALPDGLGEFIFPKHLKLKREQKETT